MLLKLGMGLGLELAGFRSRLPIGGVASSFVVGSRHVAVSDVIVDVDVCLHGASENVASVFGWPWKSTDRINRTASSSCGSGAVSTVFPNGSNDFRGSCRELANSLRQLC